MRVVAFMSEQLKKMGVILNDKANEVFELLILNLSLISYFL